MKIVISGFDLGSFRAVDPSFDEQGFLGRAESVVTLVHAARAAGDLRRARHLLTDDYAARMNAELADLRGAGRRSVYDDVRITSASVVSATSTDGTDTCGAYLEFTGAAYVAGPDGRPVQGTDRVRTWAEEWWFQRPSQESAVDTPDVALDSCSGCGAPADAAEGHTCQYCGRRLGDPSGWTLARIADADFRATPQALARRGSRMAKVIVAVVVVAILGSVGAALLVARDVTDAVTDTLGSVNIPESNPSDTDSDSDAGSDDTVTTASTFVTPVSNPRVKAPVNDVATAVADVQAAIGRPVLFSQIHLYEDGRILVEVQAPDDPASADNWTWRAGAVDGPSQGAGSMTADRFFSLDGIDLARLEELSNSALGAVGITDGFVDSPYLVAVAGGPRWYIPVTSESRSTNRKTFRVHPDGSGGEVF